MLKALFTHITYVLTFRHDGHGLPDRYGPLPYAAAAFAIVLSVTRIGLIEPDHLIAAAPSLLIAWAIIRLILSAPVFAMFALATIGTNIIFMVILVAGQNIDAESMRLTFSLWELAAVVTGAWKYGKRKSRELQDKNGRDS